MTSESRSAVLNQNIGVASVDFAHTELFFGFSAMLKHLMLKSKFRNWLAAYA